MYMSYLFTHDNFNLHKNKKLRTLGEGTKIVFVVKFWTLFIKIKFVNFDSSICQFNYSNLSILIKVFD